MREEINRIDIQVQKYLTANENCLLDYLVHRSALAGWDFSLTDIVNNTALSMGTLHRTLSKLIEKGWVIKTETHHYVFKRQEFLIWMFSKMENTKSKSTQDFPKWKEKVSKMESTNRSTNISTSTTGSTCTFQNGKSENYNKELLQKLEQAGIALEDFKARKELEKQKVKIEDFNPIDDSIINYLKLEKMQKEAASSLKTKKRW